MDNNSTDGTDKRSWRERLGIGNKEMPKIADDFKAPGLVRSSAAAPSVGAAKVAPRAPVVSTAAKAAPAVTVAKSAPMAPRVAPKATDQKTVVERPAIRVVDRITERPVVATTSASSAALAAKLSSQRDAAERLAKQRLQQISSKSTQGGEGADLSGGAKPKFIFADEEPAAAPAPVAAKPILPPRPVSMPPPPTPQMAPARPPLGAERPVAPPRPSLPQQPVAQPPVQQQSYMPPPAYVPQPQQPYQQYPQGQPYQANPQSQGYRQPMPPPHMPQGYAPVDPGYQSSPQQQPGFGQRGFAPPPQPPVQNGPRLNVPPRVPAYPPQGGFEAQAEQGFSRPPQRPLRPMAPSGPELDAPYPGEEDVFATSPQPRGRRASAQDYGQAYREMEIGYEDEEPKSRAPLFAVLALLTSLALAGGLVWFYQANKAQQTGSGGTTTEQQTAPVVEAQPEPPKVTAEPAPVDPATSPSTKQIYDRIVGDKEVLGNNLTPTEEVPVEQNAITDPGPSGSGSDEEAAPLPLPPPPGEGGQQGTLESPKSEPNQTAAAGENQAAVLPQSTVAGDQNAGLAADLKENPTPTPEPTSAPAPEVAAAEAPVPGDGLGETDDTPAPVVAKPVVKKPVVAAKRAKPRKLRTSGERDLGAKPVVLVAPQKTAKRVAETPTSRRRQTQQVASDDAAGLYGEDFQTAAADQSQEIAPSAQPKKKTLLNLFGNDSDSAGSPDLDVPAVAAPKPLLRAPQPAPTQVASAGGGYVAQLASFASEADARRAASGLKSKYPSIVGKYPTVISSGTVAGTTRYRLALGSLGSQSAASQLCNQLIAAGERDCLAKRQ